MLSIRPADIWKGLLKSVKKNKDAWVVFLGLIATSLLSFEAGLISGKTHTANPLRVELAGAPVTPTKTTASPEKTSPPGKSPVTPPQNSTSCVYVASRNSKLYHSATCAVVKRIKPANKLCFADTQEATARGLQPGCIQ